MSKAPTFTLIHTQTKANWSLDQFAGKAVMLTFWTSWCPDSRVDLSYKQRLFQVMDQTKLHMLMINVTARERIEHIEAFVKDQGYSFPVLQDDGRTVYDAYGCKGVPTTVLLDRDHQIIATYGDQASFQEITTGLAPLIT
ncbi:TlpA family protein disulfide reductase [Alkalicoccobacillus porphyridii]|uniref:TlpA family protein disulfide reductase n=1 Tax=Alkalicoccobacillus porphyridii TaxID=2597270 RepID=A0A553ZZU2_9BACI|nr:TlpA disulfide reductase family protein [Alkalicoccobacillus porphyridii]TSB46967.1 TlpA family protein disulfide reductase [Alkalicoccobacillus porphyridii]